MYKIESYNQGKLNCIKMISSHGECHAKIILDQGGSLQEFYNNNKPIIKDLSPLSYSKTYASAILFPFANRIKDGQYVFDSIAYQLEINQNEENNAIHGLVYNKKFTLSEQEVSENYATVKLIYEEKNRCNGFPFTYSIELDYLLMNGFLKLSVHIKNTDSKPFPYTLGWHPYFHSCDLSNSSLVFESLKKIIFDERMITKDVENFKSDTEFKIEDQKLDDCFVLESNRVEFITPEYNFELSSTANKNFLQVYTPDKKNTIAIEPTTGVSNSFNNGIGLQILKPNEIYTVDWEIRMLKSS